MRADDQKLIILLEWPNSITERDLLPNATSRVYIVHVYAYLHVHVYDIHVGYDVHVHVYTWM